MSFMEAPVEDWAWEKQANSNSSDPGFDPLPLFIIAVIAGYLINFLVAH
jgi:hypothetical protein